DTTPMTWPIGRGRDFIGTTEIATGAVRLMEDGGAKTELQTGVRTGPPSYPPPQAGEGREGGTRRMDFTTAAALNPKLAAPAMAEEFAIVKEACRPFDVASFREGHLTPVFFGSALKNFGVGDLLDGFAAYAPPPRAQEADARRVEADEAAMTAFVFKIQANMDPNHRDRIAFARLCSGRLTRGMKAEHVRT